MDGSRWLQLRLAQGKDIVVAGAQNKAALRAQGPAKQEMMVALFSQETQQPSTGTWFGIFFTPKVSLHNADHPDNHIIEDLCHSWGTLLKKCLSAAFFW